MIRDNLKDEALRPRPGFLVVSAMCSLGAVAAYLYEDDIIAASPGGSPMPFAILLGVLVLGAMLMLLCYRAPRIGNRFLGYDAVLKSSDKRVGEGYHYTGGFKTETGLSEKRAASRRLSARQTRRKYARATRDLARGDVSDPSET